MSELANTNTNTNINTTTTLNRHHLLSANVQASPTIDIQEGDLVSFNMILSGWIRDLYHDMDDNGYVSAIATSLCAQKTKQLVKHVLTKSSEISSIRMQRTKATMRSQNSFYHFFAVCFEACFPYIVFAFTVYTVFLWNKSITPVKSLFSTPALSSIKYEELSYIEKAYITVFSYIPTLNTVSTNVGGLFGTLLSEITHIFDTILVYGTGISVKRMLTVFYNSLVALLFGYVFFRLSIPLTSVFERYRVTNDRRENIHVLEEEFLLEFERMVERSIYNMMQPNIMKSLEQLLYMSSKSSNIESKRQCMHIVYTFHNDYNVLYMTLLTPIEQHIRMMDLGELLHMTQPSAHFTNTLFRLIRESSDELAVQLNILNQSLIEIPNSMRESLVRPMQTSLDILLHYQPVITNLVQRNL